VPLSLRVSTLVSLVKVVQRSLLVTPYFLKRIEFYKFIYLNKYLFVAFHAGAYFPLCCEVFLYFIVRVEVIEIQISLQIIKRFEKEKDFPSSYLVMG
jgi:hypothetical protein